MATRRASPTRSRISFWNGCVDIVSKPWYIDVLVVGLVALWMGWTFTTIQQQGFNLPLILSAVIIGVVGILFVYGQRVTYLRLGDRLVVGLESPLVENNQPEREEQQGRNR